MKAPPIRTWHERVDENMIVGHASCFIVRAGWVFGLSAFSLMDMAEETKRQQVEYGYASLHQAHREVERRAVMRLRQICDEQHEGRLPEVGMLRDMNGASGVDLAW